MPYPLCPEHDMREAMSDGEFWEHVFNRGHAQDDYDPDDDPNIPEIAEFELATRLAGPCPECGQVGACDYDAEGRPLIHVTDEDDDDA